VKLFGDVAEQQNKLTRQYGPIHDTILFYAKSKETRVTLGATPHTRGYVTKMFRAATKTARSGMNELTGPDTPGTERSGLPWRDYNPHCARQALGNVPAEC